MWYRGAVAPSAPCLPHGYRYLVTAQDELHAVGMWVRGELLVTSADTSDTLQGPWRFLRSDGSELNGMWQGGNCSSGTITYADGKHTWAPSILPLVCHMVKDRSHGLQLLN